MAIEEFVIVNDNECIYRNKSYEFDTKTQNYQEILINTFQNRVNNSRESVKLTIQDNIVNNKLYFELKPKLRYKYKLNINRNILDESNTSYLGVWGRIDTIIVKIKEYLWEHSFIYGILLGFVYLIIGTFSIIGVILIYNFYTTPFMVHRINIHYTDVDGRAIVHLDKDNRIITNRDIFYNMPDVHTETRDVKVVVPEEIKAEIVAGEKQIGNSLDNSEVQKEIQDIVNSDIDIAKNDNYVINSLDELSSEEKESVQQDINNPTYVDHKFRTYTFKRDIPIPNISKKPRIKYKNNKESNIKFIIYPDGNGHKTVITITKFKNGHYPKYDDYYSDDSNDSNNNNDKSA